MLSTTPYYLAFSHFLGIGPIKFNVLLKQYQTVEKAFYAPVDQLKELIGQTTAEKFAEFKRRFNIDRKLQEIAEKNIQIVTREHLKFPKSLREITDSPICLYVKGEVERYDFENEMFFAIVGTRMPTSYGQQVARKFATELSEAGCTIVSGMAMGIDTVAHQAALDAGGKTIAFLGCGVDIIYPSINHKLYHDIINNQGLVISEFPPGMTTLKGLFIARNRLISGLSSGVLVAEGHKDSGSLITARYAAQQGKEVFAPPAPITSSLAEAPNLLIKEGAKMVTCVEDIIEEFSGLKYKDRKKSVDLKGEEKMVYDFLINEPCVPDDISSECNLAIYEVLSILSSLELQGIIEKNYEGKYQVKL